MSNQNSEKKPLGQEDESTGDDHVWQMMKSTANDNPIPMQVWLKWLIFWILILGAGLGWYFW